jgi:hypothetical protein
VTKSRYVRASEHEEVPASGTLRTMKFLQSACIIGAIAALSPLATWGPSNISEPVRELVRADNSVQADDAQASDTVLNAVPIDANAVAPSSPFLLTLANRMPMSSSAKTPSATSRRTVAASAEVLPKQFLTALAAADPKPVGAPPPTRLAYAVVPDLTPDPEAHSPSPRNSETPDFSILVDYTYSEVPPPEAPADTVLRALKEIPKGTPREEVRRAAQTFGLDVTFMEAVAKIESDFDPKQRTGSYIGLFQLSKYEFDRYGSGEITDGRDNAIAGAYKFAVAAILFELQTHKKATPDDLYLIHQQGTQGAAEHVAHPDRIAWESMCATDEGRVKGERWCKRAIWQNTLPEVKKAWGSVEKLTSAAFVDMWRDRLATLYRRYSASASTAALQPPAEPVRQNVDRAQGRQVPASQHTVRSSRHTGVQNRTSVGHANHPKKKGHPQAAPQQQAAQPRRSDRG